MNDVEVTVYCTVYNHGKFLRACLEGFVNQKTNFRYKVIVHDDASTDNSAEIIREYEEKYPEIIEPIYQTENQYSKGVGIVSSYIYPRMEGKYVAVCEGDDFWIDENKLQKQYDALENNQDVHLCTCRVCETNEEGVKNGKSCPYAEGIEDGIVPAEIVVKTNADVGYQFHTSGYFFRMEQYRTFMENPDKYKVKARIGDLQLILYFAHLGDIYFIDEKLSCYRHNSTNWTSMINSNPDRMLETYDEFYNIYKKFDEYSEGRFHHLLVNRFKLIRQGYVHFCLEKKMYNRITGIKHWKYYENKKELIYCLMKVYAPQLLKIIGKAD